MAKPDDLKDTSAPDKTDNNYFLVTVDDLAPGEDYKFQFAWIYPDKRAIAEEDWSITKTVTASTEAQPNPPQFLSTDLSADIEKIFVQWNGVDNTGTAYKGIDRVEVFISGAPFDSNLPVTSFKVAGKKSITVPAGEYAVMLKAVTALGTYSDQSDEQLATVEAFDGVVVEAPLAVSGLSAAAVPFGLSVTWDGTYSGGGTFTGFQSVNIHASASDLGTTTTYSFPASSLVGHLTVNNLVNKINIGLDNLKTAMSLASNTTAYTTDTYLYATAVNMNGEPYKVGGLNTYIRINSSALRPNKANYIDLTSGVISIENLVAGNGQFTSWLRTGSSSGGARIELSSTSKTAIEAGGYEVLPGLTVYDSNSQPVFRADLAGGVSIGGYTANDIAQAQADATAAGSAASTALSKTSKLNTSGNIDASVQITTSGAIYSGKTSYSDDTIGYYIGYSGGSPVINIGNASSSIKWNGSSLDVTGNITGSTITGSELQTATSGKRVKITTDGNIEFYSPLAGTPGSIYAGIYSVGGSFGMLSITSPIPSGHYGSAITMYSDSAAPGMYLQGEVKINNDTPVGGSSSSMVRNIFIKSYLIALDNTTVTANVGDVWLQYE